MLKRVRLPKPAASATCVDVVSQLQEGEMEILCVFVPKRSGLLPGVPTCEEEGFGAVYGPSSRGFFMPKGADAALLAIDLQHHHFDFLRGRDDLARMDVLLGPRHFADVHQALDAGL